MEGLEKVADNVVESEIPGEVRGERTAGVDTLLRDETVEKKRWGTALDLTTLTRGTIVVYVSAETFLVWCGFS